MTFEWDSQKSISNREKHGIDFETAKSLWLDDKRVEIQIAFPSEDRWALIAAVEGKMWTAIYTMRNDVIRVISVRRARAREVKLYEDKTSG
jgi:uncharacterized DUF497 family protein